MHDYYFLSRSHIAFLYILRTCSVCLLPRSQQRQHLTNGRLSFFNRSLLLAAAMPAVVALSPINNSFSFFSRFSMPKSNRPFSRDETQPEKEVWWWVFTSFCSPFLLFWNSYILSHSAFILHQFHNYTY